MKNEYYDTEEAYLAALADALKVEYEAIVGHGFLLQLDCPDLAMARHTGFQDLSEAEFIKRAEIHVEAMNAAGDRKVLEKLMARLDGLKKNMTTQELENQDLVLRQIKSQNREIQRAIYKEAEELLRLQNLLEGLIKTGLTVH